MLKKNMRKRLLAGALATIMALTMCPTWALADNEGITTLPAPEDQMPVVDPMLRPKDSLSFRILHRHHPAVRTSRRLAIIAVPMKMILRIMMQ